MYVSKIDVGQHNLMEEIEAIMFEQLKMSLFFSRENIDGGNMNGPSCSQAKRQAQRTEMTCL